MLKITAGLLLGALLTITLAWQMAGGLMFREIPSPYGVEETAARIQHNILGLRDKGWVNSGLRNPARAVNNAGGNILPVLMVEACSTKYSGPILKDDETRILSILMPCSITVYKKDDGKTYVGVMNAALMGRLFGSKVAAIMQNVAEDQAQMLQFDATKPAPQLIRIQPGGGSGGGAGDGC